MRPRLRAWPLSRQSYPLFGGAPAVDVRQSERTFGGWRRLVRSSSCALTTWLDDDGGQQLNLSLLQDLRRAPTSHYPDLEAAITLARLLHEQFQRYGTDSTELITDPVSREAMRTLVALADRLGVTFKPPFRDLSGFRAYWGSHGGYGSWAARRGMLQELFDPLHEELEQLEGDILRGELAEPVSARPATGWPAVDLEIAELRRHFHAAGTYMVSFLFSSCTADADAEPRACRSVSRDHPPGEY